MKLESALPKLKICRQVLMLSTQRQKQAMKCPKMKNARAKRSKVLFSIVSCAKLLMPMSPSSSWLLISSLILS